VLVSLSNPLNPISVQPLDPDFLRWFPHDQDLPVKREGGTFSAEMAPYRNNSDDRTIGASFRVECP
jgi:hypothetical protein